MVKAILKLFFFYPITFDTGVFTKASSLLFKLAVVGGGWDWSNDVQTILEYALLGAHTNNYYYY
jgi:hypothetical protein